MMMEVSTRSQNTGSSSNTCTGDPGAWGILTTENCREWRRIPWFLRGWEISQGKVNDLKNTNTHTLQFHQNAAMQRWGQRICAMQQRQWLQYGGEVSEDLINGDLDDWRNQCCRCQAEKDCMVACQKSWMERPEFVAAVREEYLNERSHYRETGIKQTRYKRVWS